MSLPSPVTGLLATITLIIAVNESHAQSLRPDADRPATVEPASTEDAVIPPLQLAVEARHAVRSLDQTPRLTAPRPSTPLTASSVALGTLYVSTAVLQGLDVHSTLTGMRSGATETNPMMKGLVKSPGAFIVMKAGVAAGTIMAARSLAKKNRATAVLALVAFNAAYGAIVMHNYQLARQLR